MLSGKACAQPKLEPGRPLMPGCRSRSSGRLLYHGISGEFFGSGAAYSSKLQPGVMTTILVIQIRGLYKTDTLV